MDGLFFPRLKEKLVRAPASATPPGALQLILIFQFWGFDLWPGFQLHHGRPTRWDPDVGPCLGSDLLQKAWKETRFLKVCWEAGFCSKLSLLVQLKFHLITINPLNDVFHKQLPHRTSSVGTYRWYSCINTCIDIIHIYIFFLSILQRWLSLFRL